VFAHRPARGEGSATETCTFIMPTNINIREHPEGIRGGRILAGPGSETNPDGSITGRPGRAMGGAPRGPGHRLFYSMHLRGTNLPHNLAELFSIVVAVGIFMLTWNARRSSTIITTCSSDRLPVRGNRRQPPCPDLRREDRQRAQSLHPVLVRRPDPSGCLLVIAPRFAVRKIRTGATFAAFFAVTAI